MANSGQRLKSVLSMRTRPRRTLDYLLYLAGSFTIESRGYVAKNR